MTDEKLQEIEKRAAAATPGPWVVGSVTGSCSMDHGRGPMGHGQGDCQYDYRIETKGTARHCVSSVALVEVVTTCEEYGALEPANADFIANARTDMPALVAEVRRLFGMLSAANHVGFTWRDKTMAAESERAAALSRVADLELVVTSFDEELDAIRAWNEGNVTGATCAFCAPAGSITPERRESMRVHVTMCPDHPAYRLMGEAAAARVDVASTNITLDHALSRVADLEASLEKHISARQDVCVNEMEMRRQRDEARAEVAEATRERDEARDRIRRLQAEVVEHCENLNDRVHGLHVERAAKDVVLDKLAEVTAQAAAMREALEAAREALLWAHDGGWHDASKKVDSALAPDAGRALLAEVTALREVAAKARRYACGADSKGYPCECLFCSALAKLDALKVPT
jgi:hypothetical protein